MQIAKTISAND